MDIVLKTHILPCDFYILKNFGHELCQPFFYLHSSYECESLSDIMPCSRTLLLAVNEIAYLELDVDLVIE